MEAHNLSLLNPLSSHRPFSFLFSTGPHFSTKFPTATPRGRKTRLFSSTCCLNISLPLVAKSSVAKSLIGLIQNDPNSFYHAVDVELNRVSLDRDSAFDRFYRCKDSPEAVLHRRIAELKETECQNAVEDVLYMIILYKFSEIRVPLVPSLSQCLYNNRLEILPSKDWELESIHSLEALEMVREHLTSVLGWKASSSVSVNWSTTKIRRVALCRLYQSSISFGYFLKSTSMRLRLEHNLPQTYQNAPFGNLTPPLRGTHGGKNLTQRQLATPRSTTLSQVPTKLGEKEANLKFYVESLDHNAKEHCAKLKSKEAVNLVDKHCLALFTSDKASTNEENELILTSLSSLKRLVLEAVAFGCFLWDAEHCVDKIYELNDRY